MLSCLISSFFFLHSLRMVDAFMGESSFLSTSCRQSLALRVSELHIPGYSQSKLPFILTENDLTQDAGNTLVRVELKEKSYSNNDFISDIPFETGHLVHKTKDKVFTSLECQDIVKEAEERAAKMGWTTNRHGNYPTTDIPLVELPRTMKFLRRALAERLYPLLRAQFKEYLPPGDALFRLRVADGFIVKYDADGGQSELKPHRDGSVFSFNIALNPASDYEGGGTWFDSLGSSIKIDEGNLVTHASGVLHGGHGITKGKRYIMVGFVILEGYDSWSMRYYNKVRNQ